MRNKSKLKINSSNKVFRLRINLDSEIRVPALTVSITSSSIKMEAKMQTI